MSAILLEGKPIAEKIRGSIQAEVAAIKAKSQKIPRLTALQIGEDASSAIYIKNQKKAAEKIGIEYELKTLGRDASQAEVEGLIDNLNKDPQVTAVILQLPVPKGIDAGKTVRLISPDKDAEGMHPQNIGKILFGEYRIGPCTAMAVMELLESIKAELYGKETVIVGHSDIVGKPLSLMLLNKFATTTVCHIATDEKDMLPEHIKRADLLIVAVGKAGLIKGEWVKIGAIVIDIGINRVGDKIIGDVEFEGASKKASYITPVPGGVGPLTTTILMRNVLELFKSKL